MWLSVTSGWCSDAQRSGMTNIVDGLLGRIEDDALRRALSVEVARLRESKDFGLVFERHVPENVRLLNHPIRRGVKV